MRFKFVHAADIHLDSPLRGLARYDGLPLEQFRGATRRAFERLIDLCRDEGAAFLLIAGDLYDGEGRDFNTALFFAAEMSRLNKLEIPAYLVSGNHDAQSVMMTHALRLPANVHHFSSRKPETKLLERLGVAIHGQSYAKRAVMDDLSASYPERVQGLVNIGLLHTSANGRAGHEPYAPCSAAALVEKGYDYWALGHVHAREELSREPYVVFPGNLQGRHVRETGAKGATVVTVEDGRVAQVEHRPLDVVRWAVCDVDLATAASPHDAVELARQALEREVQAAGGRAVAARVRLYGSSAAHAALVTDQARWANEIRSAASALEGEGVWVEKLVVTSSAPLNLSALREQDDAVGVLLRAIQELRVDDAALTSMLDDLRPLRDKLPPEVREGDDALRLDEPAVLRAALADVEQLLLPRLLSGGGAS